MSTELDAANTRLAEAQATLAVFEAEKMRLENERIRQEIDDDAARYARRNRDEAIEDAADEDLSHVYYFNDSVTASSVALCRRKLNQWRRHAPGCDIEIVFNSGGGSVFDGFDLMDVIESLKDADHHVTTRIAGMSASMAGVLAQMGTKRLIGRHSRLHLHETSTASLGKASDLRDTAELAESLTRQICQVYADRARIGGKTDAMTGEEIFDWIARQERWLDANQALEMGFADAIV